MLGEVVIDTLIAHATVFTSEQQIMSDVKFSARLDTAIFAAVLLVLVCLIALLAANLVFQYSNYRDGIKLAIADPKIQDHASILTYSRAWDFAVTKTSALFLSFLLTFVGALYVLRTADTAYGLVAENGNFKASLSTSSPGLVMITLGVVLAAYALSVKTYLEYNRKGVAQIEAPATKPSQSNRTPLPESPNNEMFDTAGDRKQ